jgi:cytoskeletal protein CcmA (bactofilin family)
MGFLSRVGKESGRQPRTTFVAGATKIVGDLELDDDFHLDGTMNGAPTSSCNVTIGVGGAFNGDIQAKKVFVSGQVEGRIDAQCLEVVGPGKARGEIRVSQLVIEPGGQFNGSSQIKSLEDQEPWRIAHQPASGKTETSRPTAPAMPTLTKP